MLLTFRLRYSRTREEETSSRQAAMANRTAAFCPHANNKTPRSYRGDGILAFSNTFRTGRYDITPTNVYQTFRLSPNATCCYQTQSQVLLTCFHGDRFFSPSSFIDRFIMSELC